MTLISKRRYFRLILLNLIFVALISLFVSSQINSTRREYIEELRIDTLKQIRLLEAKEEGNFSQELMKSEIEDVPAMASKFDNSFYKDRNLTKTGIMTFLLVSGAFSLMQVVNYLVINSQQRKYIKSVDAFLDSVLNKKFNIALKENDEGVISKLNNRFNKLGIAIKRNYSDLNKEKVKLQDSLADISHQIKTPLAALSMYNEILIESENLEEDQRDFLNMSQDQISRLRWLISALLTISRFEADAVQMNPETFVASELSSNIEQVLMDNLRKNNLSIKVVGDIEKEVTLDYRWTREALVNIVKNASEHAYQNTEIIIEYTINIAMIRIDVINNGDKISSEDITKVFTRFYKSSNNKNPDSVGIGLNLSKNIIENQLGTINVQNIEDGVMFSILFLK